MRQNLSVIFDCEKFIAHFKNLSSNLRIYRSFLDFIAQSGDISLKRVSPPSSLVETLAQRKEPCRDLAEWLLSSGFLNGKNYSFCSISSKSHHRNIITNKPKAPAIK